MTNATRGGRALLLFVFLPSFLHSAAALSKLGLSREAANPYRLARAPEPVSPGSPYGKASKKFRGRESADAAAESSGASRSGVVSSRHLPVESSHSHHSPHSQKIVHTVICNGFPHAVPVQMALGERPHKRKTAWQSLEYGKCRQVPVAHNQVFLFHFPRFGAEHAAFFAPGTRARSERTVVFPKRAAKVFRKRPVILIGGDARLRVMQLPLEDDPHRAQLVLADAFAPRRAAGKARKGKGAGPFFFLQGGTSLAHPSAEPLREHPAVQHGKTTVHDLTTGVSAADEDASHFDAVQPSGPAATAPATPVGNDVDAADHDAAGDDDDIEFLPAAEKPPPQPAQIKPQNDQSFEIVVPKTRDASVSELPAASPTSTDVISAHSSNAGKSAAKVQAGAAGASASDAPVVASSEAASAKASATADLSGGGGPGTGVDMPRVVIAPSRPAADGPSSASAPSAGGRALGRDDRDALRSDAAKHTESSAVKAGSEVLPAAGNGDKSASLKFQPGTREAREAWKSAVAARAQARSDDEERTNAAAWSHYVEDGESRVEQVRAKTGAAVSASKPAASNSVPEFELRKKFHDTDGASSTADSSSGAKRGAKSAASVASAQETPKKKKTLMKGGNASNSGAAGEALDDDKGVDSDVDDLLEDLDLEPTSHDVEAGGEEAGEDDADGDADGEDDTSAVSAIPLVPPPVRDSPPAGVAPAEAEVSTADDENYVLARLRLEDKLRPEMDAQRQIISSMMFPINDHV